MLAARVGVLAVVAGVVGLLGGACVNLSYPPGASRDGGALMAQLPNGNACTKDGDCQSGFCVDKVCCKTECAGDCFTCAKSGSEGFCMPADVDTDPRDKCEDLTPAKCSTNGTCDGAGQCAKYQPGTVCEPASCLVFDAYLAGRCNAEGVCEKGAKKDCAPYVCGPDGACLTSCTQPRECAAMKCYDDGTCGLKALGTPCGNKSECQSGQCEQGLCCDKACAGACRSCALQGSEGVCTNVPAGTTPAGGGCAVTDATTCGTNGKCDGAGACQLYPSGTMCSPASCSTATLRNAGTCDGMMHCQVPAAVTCGGYTCASTTACRTTCAADADCASPSICGVPRVAACGGLSAQYFRQTNLTDMAFSRTDPYIDFDWGGGSPSPLLNVDNFSVRWRGKLTARFSEKYTFYAASDDGERLIVDGKVLIDRFTRHASVPEDVSGTIQLTAGKPVDFTFEYFENGGDANVRLSWSSMSEQRAVIPTSAFAPQ